MNRLGVKTQDEFNSMYQLAKHSNVKLKGLYTHIYYAEDEKTVNEQIKLFKGITNDIDLNSIDMVHIAQSDTFLKYPKIDICNGCRLGIAMYGLTANNLRLKSTCQLISEIIEIKKIKKGECVSYGGKYIADSDEIIGVVSIGYADGVNRHLSGAYIYINNYPYQIIGNICMDMLMVRIDENVHLYDKVYIYKDINHIKKLSKYLDTIPYELICNITKRVPRIYEKDI